MAADISRIRANPLLDFIGVELKQGGVLLDADFNELVAVVDRRLRAAASDVLGRATVSQTTPDAFKIGVQAGVLTIGKGRLYVDGLLAECHGGPAADAARKQFDPLLAEVSFPDPLSYASQPFLQAPPALPANGRHLVYLDVWEREVTHIERPELVEIAVNVETSSRRQVVWQVRVLADAAGAADCATPDAGVAGWSALTAPSAARLTTGTFQGAPANPDPCELPPTGGYRGLENQTYRIEVHDAGLPGAGATFKWSRDNASVASRVRRIVSSVNGGGISRTVIELASLGRDDVLRFNSGDWVEITDDLREQAQRSGDMRRVTVDDAAQTLTFSPALSPDLLPVGPLPADTAPFAAARHLRARRWDQQGQVLRVTANGGTAVHQDLNAAGGTGVINVPAGGATLLLEQGVTVSFTAVGNGRLRAGDHWVVAARTADASVELLANEPPRGIHHHYARLGFWNVATGQVTDCRVKWPPGGGGAPVEHHDCGCTVCVTPQSHSSGTLTIQMAVDRVRQRDGGTVCIAIGDYLLDQPVRLSVCSSMRIHGEGPGTLLIGLKGGAFTLTNCTAVTLEDMTILSTGDADAIRTQTCIGLTLQRLVVAIFTDRKRIAAIGLAGIAAGVVVRDNVLIAPLGVAAGVYGKVGDYNDVRIGLLFSAVLRIEDNLMVCARCAVDLSGLCVHMMGHEISGNEITACSEDGIRLLGIAAPASAMRVCSNLIGVHGHGISAGVDGLWIEGNKLRAGRVDKDTPTGVGVRLLAGLDPNGPDQCHLLANQIDGFEQGGVRAGSRSADLVIKLNVISHCGYGIWLQDDGKTERASIENNHLSDIGEKTGFLGTVAIALNRVGIASVAGNTIARVGLKADQASFIAGVFTVGVEQLRLTGNAITDIGPPGGLRTVSVGAAVGAPFQHVDAAHNQIDRESDPTDKAVGMFCALWIGDVDVAAGPMSSTGRASGHMSASAGAITVVFGSSDAYVRQRRDGDVAHASVQANSLRARGLLPAVQVAVSGDCQFSDNRCELRGKLDNLAAVDLLGRTAVVHANRVQGGAPSIRIDKAVQSIAVVGNITTSPIEAGAPWPGPWGPLNVIG